jgi:hypothetical protein
LFEFFTLAAMIKIFLFVTVFLFQDLQKQVEAAVKKHIVNNVDDPAGFEVVEFGKVEKFMTNVQMTPDGKRLWESYKKYIDISTELLKKYDRVSDDEEKAALLQDSKMNMATAKKLKQQLDAEEAKYKPHQYGWQISVKYRVKDYEGKLRLRETYYYLDKKLKLIDPGTIVVYN